MDLVGIKIDLNIGPQQADNCHGRHAKELVVLHETVSRNYSGLGDVRSISEYLDNRDWGIHCITDNDGNLAWAHGMGTCVFYHTASGGHEINTRSVGIEQISRVMLDYTSRLKRLQVWLGMTKELQATAEALAICNLVHGIPLRYSDGTRPGVTTHWQITQTYNVIGGHVDCYPYHLGGYYPVLRVIKMAQDVVDGLI